MTRAKSITIILKTGNPDGLKTINMAGTNLAGTEIDRSQIEEESLDDEDTARIDLPGVYFLICEKDEPSDDYYVYVGESENVLQRLHQHLDNARTKPHVWKRAICFTSNNDLDMAPRKSLENKMQSLLRTHNSKTCLTAATTQPFLNVGARALVEDYEEILKTFVKMLGYNFLDKNSGKHSSGTSQNIKESLHVFHYGPNNAGVEGQGYLKDGKFILMAGSKTAKDTQKSCPKNAAEYRKKNKIEGMTTEKDIEFDSSSFALSVLTGTSISGPDKWKDKDDKRLRDYVTGA